MAVTEEEVFAALKECYDPEIPVNVVDLGLIYEVQIKPGTADAAGDEVEVVMTLTAPQCPMHGAISDSVEQRLLQIPGVTGAVVNVVWYPPWTPKRLSSDARKQLGIE